MWSFCDNVCDVCPVRDMKAGNILVGSDGVVQIAGNGMTVLLYLHVYVGRREVRRREVGRREVERREVGRREVGRREVESMCTQLVPSRVVLAEMCRVNLVLNWSILMAHNVKLVISCNGS